MPQYDPRLPLEHSWPLYNRDRHFDLGHVHDDAIFTPLAVGGANEDMTANGVGIWECTLADNSLRWSDAVYDIFGIARGADVRRDDAAALYAEGSRAAMEQLRAYAIRHQRGFTLDVEIRPARKGALWVRLIAAPLCVDGEVVAMQGVKKIIARR